MVTDDAILSSPGSHICSIYQNSQQQFSQLSRFFSLGLSSNHQCIYVYEESDSDDIRRHFKQTGIDVDYYESISQLIFNTKKETYLSQGTFDPDTSISMISSATTDALEHGYSGLFLTAETSWLVHDNVSTTSVFDYEKRCNSCFNDQTYSAICQYNETIFPKKFLINMICSHPYLLLYGQLYENTYFHNPLEYSTDVSNQFRDDDYQPIIDLITNQ